MGVGRQHTLQPLDPNARRGLNFKQWEKVQAASSYTSLPGKGARFGTNLKLDTAENSQVPDEVENELAKGAQNIAVSFQVLPLNASVHVIDEEDRIRVSGLNSFNGTHEDSVTSKSDTGMGETPSMSQRPQLLKDQKSSFTVVRRTTQQNSEVVCRRSIERVANQGLLSR